jgi:hypothetical protein
MTLLPTFFIVGAPKCGTTSLHEYLDAHPDVAMTTDKEPSIFGRPDDWEEMLSAYARLFVHDAPIRGESSTSYASYPWRPWSADNIQARVPDARIVYLVRDPIRRTLSHYAMNVWQELPVRPFDELMEDLEDHMNMPVWCSRYGTQIERWLDRFGQERVLVLDSDDLRGAQRTTTIQRVLGFVGADPSFMSPAWDAEHNTATHHRTPRRGVGRLGRVGRGLVATPGIGRLATREIPTPTLSAEQRERLVALLSPDIARFRELTGFDTSKWEVTGD